MNRSNISGRGLIDAVLHDLHVGQSLLKQNRERGLAALNELFRAGMPPQPPLDGPYVGQLVGLNIAPGLTQMMEMILARWLPWQGKTFDPVRARGDNIFSRESLGLARLYWPFYRGYIDDGGESYRAFTFCTYTGPGQTDPDCQVLKIDYDQSGNPRLSIRRVLDELVQITDGLYLGKAHLKWWWGTWQMVAYFSLRKYHLNNSAKGVQIAICTPL